MQLHTLATHRGKTARPSVGRGGRRGKTSGRGTKGQKARAGHKIRPEMRDVIKKLPKRRGYGKNRSRTVRMERVVFAPVTLAALQATYTAGETVSPKTLLTKGLVRRMKGRVPAVKILGTGSLEKKLIVVGCAASVSAREAICAVGGTYTSAHTGATSQ